MKNWLIWLPHETTPYPVPEHHIEFNGKTYRTLCDKQDDHDSHWCRHRQSWDGRCAIHPTKPFAADFECIKFFVSSSDTRPTQLRSQPFPRKWSYTRVDGEKGGLCETLPITKESHEDVLRRLRRLADWAEYFEIKHVMHDVIAWLETGPHDEAKTFNQPVKKTTGFVTNMFFETL